MKRTVSISSCTVHTFVVTSEVSIWCILFLYSAALILKFFHAVYETLIRTGIHWLGEVYYIA